MKVRVFMDTMSMELRLKIEEAAAGIKTKESEWRETSVVNECIELMEIVTGNSIEQELRAINEEK